MTGLIKQRDEIDKMQCDFTSGRGTNMHFYCMSPTEESHDCLQPLYMTSIDLEEAFDQINEMSSEGQCSS